jgi:hypothetical protein
VETPGEEDRGDYVFAGLPNQDGLVPGEVHPAMSLPAEAAGWGLTGQPCWSESGDHARIADHRPQLSADPASQDIADLHDLRRSFGHHLGGRSHRD